MKLIISFLALYFVMDYSCYAQKKAGELIPVINHSYKIDSLIKDLIDSGNGWISKDKCLAISFSRRDSLQFVDLNSREKEKINNIATAVHLRKEHLEFFALGSYKVFVVSRAEFSGLFSPTKKSKRIDFIDYSHAGETPSIPEIPILAQYVYKNGKFGPMFGPMR